MITLQLWVANQIGDSDQTINYIEATGWHPPAGVVFDEDEQTLSGIAELTWQAYRTLAALVTRVGHGVDVDDDEIDAPALTACPVELMVAGCTCAAESLARQRSQESLTWEEFAAVVLS